jgi:hypothetical protein
MKSGHKYGARIRDSAPVAVSQEDDSIRARYRAPSLSLKKPEEESLDPFSVCGPLGRIGLGYE